MRRKNPGASTGHGTGALMPAPLGLRLKREGYRNLVKKARRLQKRHGKVGDGPGLRELTAEVDRFLAGVE